MKHISYLIWGIVLLLLFFANTIISQDKAPTDELYLMHEDVIKIDKVDQYEATVKKELELWKKYNLDTDVRFAAKTDDNHYYYLTAIENFAGIDLESEKYAKLTERAGKTLTDLYEEYKGTYESHRNVVIRRSVELSYKPENPRLKPEETKFIHWDHYYVKEGHMEEVKTLMKEYQDLMINNKSGDAYNVWIGDIGTDIGWLVMTTHGKSSVDYYTNREKSKEVASEEKEALWGKFAPHLKNWSHYNGVPRPDFTYSLSKD